MKPFSLKKTLSRQTNIQIAWKDTFIAIAVLLIAALICTFLQHFSSSDNYAPMVFCLAVFFVSRFTNGYLYGIISSLFGVVCVNFIFTYPYFALNFTNTGYPVTFACMLATSFFTCAMTTQLKQSEKIKAEISEEKIRANLLRAISHDLRTPLTSIVGSLQAVIDNRKLLSNEQTVSLLSEARDDAQWLIRIVENILSITKINSSEARIKKSPEAAEEVIGEAVRKLCRRFPDITIKVTAPNDLLLIPMDPLLIEQVLENLMENSILHGITTKNIDVNVRTHGKTALFSVLDDGKGIKAEALPHLFDGKLISSDNKEADSKKNMGIGLSVCMSIVRAHGGDMTAMNLPFGGASFQFTLPLEEETKNEQ